jgi:hypothetical protein
MAKNPVRILSIDGGGIRGILPARVLQALERLAGKPVTEMFDLIAGTSTGGIIGCGLVAGVPIGQLADLYVQHGGEIFDRSLWRTVTTLNNLSGPKYSADRLEELLKQQLGDTLMLSQVSKPPMPELLVPAYCIQLPKPVSLDGSDVLSMRTPYFFKSWKASGRCLDKGDAPSACDFPLWQVARATSAAPTYFPPASIRNADNEPFAMVDGGVFANNPAMCALASAQKLFDADEAIVVSLGTGSLERPIKADAAAEWGEVAWLHPLLSIFMDGNADTVCYQLSQLPQVRDFRFEISTGTDSSKPETVNEDFDDARVDNINRLEALAQKMLKVHDDRLKTVANLLKSSEPAARRP